MPECSISTKKIVSQQTDACVESIYRSHHHWLYTWLGRKMDCSQDAADVSQDAFLNLLKSDEVRSLREPRAYLLVIANRLMINRFRRRKVEKEVLQHMSVMLEDVENRTPEEINLNYQLLRKIVLMLLEELPEKPRRAFLMAKVDGLSYSQISNKLNVSQSSVKQYLAKALSHCHKRMYLWSGEE